MIGIVVVCYNREDCMKNILSSISKAEYNEEATLIISIDKSEKQEKMVKIANDFIWTAGRKIIRAYDERQGLKQHILNCGDLTFEYEAVIILEDDLLVSKYYFSYVRQALSYFSNDDRIAGISLYKHLITQGCFRIFEPECNGYDTYLMQYAQSWGQCWNHTMWQSFKEWLAKQSGELKSDGIIPEYVAKWDNRSWLKYYMKYTSETGKYFVYPYVSLTTNNSEPGEHNPVGNNDFQVPLLSASKKYHFPTFEEAIKYDSFFERIFPENYFEKTLKGKVVIDLYGMKINYFDADYLISTRKLNYKVEYSLGLKYRPHEVNIINFSSGNDIWVYNLHIIEKNKRSNKYNLIRYDIRALHWKKTLYHGIRGFIKAIIRRIRK